MGRCIICGTSVDGHICGSHEEDVVFEFEGTRANQLTSGRFYRGAVDGFADFGVFIDIGDSVTGLLHRSELDRRLESLDWDAGETVYVQVTGVHDNGNVDLAWSIRQSEREFRGALIDDPEGDRLPETEAEPEAGAEVADPNEHAATDPSVADTSDGAASSRGPDVTDDEAEDIDGADDVRAAEATLPADGGNATLVEPTADTERVPVGALDEHIDDPVRIEGEVTGVRQTGGPTVFELSDESGTVDCAAFEEAGVRAYPDVETGEIVTLHGTVERHRDAIQVETEGLSVLDDAERDDVERRMADALAEQARPEAADPLADDPLIEDLSAEIRDLAGVIRRAVIEARPVVVRHDASADGYVAAAAIERATLPLVREEHARHDAEYHYFDRRPLEDGVYDMNSATRDVSTMLDARERHDERLPLFVFCGVGGTRASLDGLSLLSVYDVERAVIDAELEDAGDVDTVIGPREGETTASALAANVAAHVNPDVRDDLEALPAVGFWEDVPEAYATLAAEAGFDAERRRDVREAIALVANYQAYEDKRELVTDLLFDGRASLAARLAGQFREKLEAALSTAETHLEHRETGERTIAVLDTDAFTHRYDFPPTSLLCDALYRNIRADAAVLLGLGGDELYLRGDDLDSASVAETVAERVPDAGVSARDGRIEFLLGEREAVGEATVDALAEP